MTRSLKTRFPKVSGTLLIRQHSFTFLWFGFAFSRSQTGRKNKKRCEPNRFTAPLLSTLAIIAQPSQIVNGFEGKIFHFRTFCAKRTVSGNF